MLTKLKNRMSGPQMIAGYSGNLNFKRDFLSEGMDMINRIGMTENNMDIIEYKINGSI